MEMEIQMCLTVMGIIENRNAQWMAIFNAIHFYILMNLNIVYTGGMARWRPQSRRPDSDLKM